MRHLEYMKKKLKEVEEKSKEQTVKYLSGKNKEEQDMVNHPEHYNQGTIECIDAIEAMLSQEEFVGYLRGNSLKYRWRFRYKNGIEDLRKAEWYERRLLKILEDK